MRAALPQKTQQPREMAKKPFSVAHVLCMEKVRRDLVQGRFFSGALWQIPADGHEEQPHPQPMDFPRFLSRTNFRMIAATIAASRRLIRIVGSMNEHLPIS